MIDRVLESLSAEYSNQYPNIVYKRGTVAQQKHDEERSKKNLPPQTQVRISNFQ